MFASTISKSDNLNEPLLERNALIHPIDEHDYQYEGASRLDQPSDVYDEFSDQEDEYTQIDDQKSKVRNNKQMSKNGSSTGRDHDFLKGEILVEPRVKIDIPNLQAEQSYFRKEKIMQKPKAMYLDYCEKYAKLHLTKTQIPIDDYRFKKEDVENESFSRDVIRWIKQLGTNGIDPMQLSDEDFADLFQTETIKLFTDFIFHNSEAYIIVKSWQKVNFKLAEEQEEQQQMQRNRSSMARKQNRKNDMRTSTTKIDKNIVNTAMYSQQNQSISKNSFYIKTLEVRDKFGQPLSTSGPILVEQVFGVFDQVRLYDTSYIQNQEKLYFFKRHFINPDEYVDDFVQDPGIEEWDINNPQGLHIQNSCLILHEYDFKNCKEKIVQEIFYRETEEAAAFEEAQRSRRQSTISRKQDKNSQFAKLTRKAQFNLIFSKQFGNTGKQCHDTKNQETDFIDLIAFFKQQYCAVQQYTLRQEFHHVRIYRIHNQDQMSGWLQILIDTSKPQMIKKQDSDRNDQKQFLEEVDIELNAGCNRQIQNFNHIFPSNISDDTKKVCFIITNMFQQIQISINNFDEASGDTPIPTDIQFQEYDRKQTDIFQRIWNQCGIIPMSANIEQTDPKKKEKVNIQQYFFIDSRNKIQLLYPNYDSNIDTLRAIENIASVSNHQQKDSNEFKKVVCLSIDKPKIQDIGTIDDANQMPVLLERMIVREINSLKKTLNDDQINTTQSLTFIKDNESQILYVTEPKSKEIWRYELKNTLIHECLENPDLMIALDPTPTNTIGKPLKQVSEYNVDRAVLSDMSDKNNSFTQNQEVEANQQMEGQRSNYLRNLRKDHHTASYLSYKGRKLSENEELNYVYVDDLNGGKYKIKLYEIMKEMIVPQQIKLIWFQISQNSKYAFFFFRAYNEKSRDEQQTTYEGSEKLIRRSYFFLRKTQKELKDIAQKSRPLIGQFDKVFLLKSYHAVDYVDFQDIKNFQFPKLSVNNPKDTCHIQKGVGQCYYRDINAIIPKDLPEPNEQLDFFAFIYQEKSNSDNNKLIVFNVDTFEQPEHYSINANPSACDFIFEDEEGYNTFMIVRSSEIDIKPYGIDDIVQRARYQIFTLYSEKVGRIQGEEFLVMKDNLGARAHTIGQKQILLSNKIIQDCEWSNIKDSHVCPYKEANGKINGCRFILQKGAKTRSIIPLVDYINDLDKCLYTYQSQVILTGKQLFSFDPSDPDLYAIVISSLLRTKIIELGLFERSEAFTVLQIAQEHILKMRQPDLELMILSSFGELLKSEFFQSQEMLQGKSLCDICLSDSELIKEAIKSNKNQNTTLNASTIEDVIAGDKLRKETFVSTEFYPKQLIIQVDLNFVSTVERAIAYISYKSLKQMLEEILQTLCHPDYQPLLMYDLPFIMESKQVQINEFFQLNKSEVNYAACNLEIEFESAELPPFSDNEEEHQTINGFQNFLNIKDEITEYIVMKDQKKPDGLEKEFEIEYFYIDFHMQIIGEKIRAYILEKPQKKFDDLYYACIIAKKAEDEINNKFFQQKSVQKLIDSQWVQTKRIQVSIFIIYFMFYIVPMCICSFKISDEINNNMFKIAMGPALILLVIESIQIKQQGLEYFIGWNMIDFLQLVIFGVLFFLRFEGLDNDLLYFAQLKLINIVLAFFKLLFFVRIFEAYGFLVQMVVYCVQDLIPFLCSYVTFLMVFSICYVVLQLDIDEEVAEAALVLNYFCKTLLETFRNAIGELALPAYNTLLEKNTENYTKEPSIFVLYQYFTLFGQSFLHKHISYKSQCLTS